MTEKNFSPLSFVALFGSGIRDPGFGINIPDPQHRFFVEFIVVFYSRNLQCVFDGANCAVEKAVSSLSSTGLLPEEDRPENLHIFTLSSN
jgi:hypothetical protein